jgi:phytoene dehydrogenase-like protein
MPNHFDTIIIGAGLNGLTTAAYLAKAGQGVLVLEQRAVIGGAAATEEILSGFKFDTVTHNVVGLPMQVVRELNLARYGLQLIDADPNLYAPLPDGEGITLWRDDNKAAESIRRFSQKDATRWMQFKTRVTKLAAVLTELHAVTPPRVGELDAAQLWALGVLGFKLRGLGKRDMPAFLRALAMPVQDLLDDEFENDLLKGALGSVGVRGMRLGPRGTGTAHNFLRGCTRDAIGATHFVRGGVGNVANALAQAAQARGATIRTNARVVHINAREQKINGVVLASGEEIAAARVVSAIDPRQTFLHLIDPLQLDPTFVWRVRHIRMNGIVAKVNLALDGLPNFRAASPEQLRGTITIAPNLDYIERAYDDAKYGAVSRQPLLEVTIPTLSDPSRAPQGKHVLSVWMQYAPYELETGDLSRASSRDWRREKEQLGDLVVRILSEYAPNLQSLILQSQILTPCDLEETYGVTEGDLNHGQVALDQFLFMRPVPGYAQYRAPLEGLYLCDAGTHPGGLPCAAGRNAAREIRR